MIEVELPDGSIAEFPEGTANDVIKGVLQKRLSQPQPPAQSNADGTFGEPPEGMVLNPKTGQMEDMRSPINPNIPTGGMNAAAIGMGQGAGFGLLDEASAGLSTLVGGDYEYNLARMREAERRASDEHPVAYYGGMLGGGAAQGAGIVGAGLSPSAALVQSGARLPAVAAASGVEGLALGGVHGFGSGEGTEGRLNQAESGAKWGLGLGAATPYAVKGIESMARRALSPFASSSERAAAVKILEQEGVNLTAGQKTGSNWLRYRESELGGAKAAQMMDDQGRAFTDAAMRKAGGSGLADSDNLRTISSRLSQGFDDISSRNTLRADQPLADGIVKTLRDYNRVLPSDQKQIFGNLTADLIDRIKNGNGTLSGADYQAIRSRFTTLAHNSRNNEPNLAEAFRGIRNSLDDAMNRSVSPSDAGKWGELRRQYGNMKVLEKAAVGGGEDAAIGMISPARLRMAASSGNQGGYARGQGDFAELAKAGQAAMTPLPNSGTAQRVAAHGMFSGLAAGGGALAGGPLGMAAGLAAPFVAGRTLMSKPVQGYLANQVATGSMSKTAQAIAQMLLTGQSSALAGRLPSP